MREAVLQTLSEYEYVVIGDKLALESVTASLQEAPTLKKADEDQLGASTLTQEEMDSATQMDSDEVAQLERQLAIVWNEYRDGAPNRINIPALDYDPGCGDGDVSVEISTKPPGATVSVIDTFDWLICLKRKLNPWDPGSCDGQYPRVYFSF